MPFPFSHLVYADKILKSELRDREIIEREYFMGASFPDIRYFLKVPRAVTHTDVLEPEYFLGKMETEQDCCNLSAVGKALDSLKVAR